MRRIHFIGIGGVGMNGLAQLAAQSGFSVTGSDRAYDPEAELFGKLQAQNIRIVLQDGTGVGVGPGGVGGAGVGGAPPGIGVAPRAGAAVNRAAAVTVPVEGVRLYLAWHHQGRSNEKTKEEAAKGREKRREAGRS